MHLITLTESFFLLLKAVKTQTSLILVYFYYDETEVSDLFIPITIV